MILDRGTAARVKQLRFVQISADSLGEGDRTDAMIIDFSKAFVLAPHDRLLTQTAATGVDLRAVVWVKEFLLGR